MTNTIKVGPATFQVTDTAQCDREGRALFEWTCAVDGASWGDTDLRGPAAGPEPSEQEMLATLLVFVGAALESRAYRERTGRQGDHEDLFPAAMLDALAGLSDAVDMARFELDPEALA